MKRLLDQGSSSVRRAGGVTIEAYGWRWNLKVVTPWLRVVGSRPTPEQRRTTALPPEGQ